MILNPKAKDFNLLECMYVIYFYFIPNTAVPMCPHTLLLVLYHIISCSSSSAILSSFPSIQQLTNAQSSVHMKQYMEKKNQHSYAMLQWFVHAKNRVVHSVKF